MEVSAGLQAAREKGRVEQERADSFQRILSLNQRGDDTAYGRTPCILPAPVN